MSRAADEREKNNSIAHGITVIFSPLSHGSCIGFYDVERMLDVPLAIGGLASAGIQAAKLPCLATLYGLCRWLKSILVQAQPKDIESQKHEFVPSTAIRFANTCQLLVVLGLETTNSISDHIYRYQTSVVEYRGERYQGLVVLCAFTALGIAFASRRLPPDCILMANGQVLFRDACPPANRSFFSAIVRLRNTLRLATSPGVVDSHTMLRWIPELHKVLYARMAYGKPDKNKPETLRNLVSDMLTAGKCAINSSQQRRREEYNAAVSSSSSSSSSSHLDISPRVLNRLADSRTGKAILCVAVVMPDGLVYDGGDHLRGTGQVLRAWRRSTQDDLRVDPITCKKMTSPVVANDGFLYDVSTFAMMQKQGLVGCGGVVIERCIACRCHLWRSCTLQLVYLRMRTIFCMQNFWKRRI